MAIRKWIGCLLFKSGNVDGFGYNVPKDVKQVLIDAVVKKQLDLSGSYRAYLVVKLGGCTLELVSLKGGDEVVTVDVLRVILFDGEHAVALQQMLEEGKNMVAVRKSGIVPVVEHSPVGLTLIGGPMVGLKLKPDPFGLHT